MARIDFGDPHTFAVSVQLLPDYHGQWLYGNLCYWVANQMVGDFGIVTSLRDVLGQMQLIVKDAGRRDNPTLFNASEEDVFFSLNVSLYDIGDDLECRSTVQLPEMFAVFDGKIPVEPFDGWKFFIIDCGDKTKVLFKQRCETVRTATFRQGEFDRALLALYHYIDNLIERESIQTASLSTPPE